MSVPSSGGTDSDSTIRVLHIRAVKKVDSFGVYFSTKYIIFVFFWY
jgi:hypothetical protein